jgi:hypothetical protein
LTIFSNQASAERSALACTPKENLVLSTFKIVRENGKSNSDVIIELVKDATPQTCFTYEQINAALSESTNTTYDTPAVQGAVRIANSRLLREHSRYLGNVRNKGYRIIPASEHKDVAKKRNRKAARQEQWALNTLRHARRDEMTQQERDLHDAHLILHESMNSHRIQTEAKLKHHEHLVASLTHRVEQLEGKQS